MPHNPTSDKILRVDFRRVCGFISHDGYTIKRNGVDVIYSNGYPSNFFMCFVIEKANNTPSLKNSWMIVEEKAIAKANELAEAKAAFKVYAAIEAKVASAKA